MGSSFDVMDFSFRYLFFLLMLIKSCIFVFFFLLPFQGIYSDTKKKFPKKSSDKNSPITLHFYEKGRVLLVLPMYNETGEPLFDHLAITASNFIAGNLKNIAYYVTTKYPQQLLYVSPEQPKEAKKAKKNLYYQYTKQVNIGMSMEAKGKQYTQLFVKKKKVSPLILKGWLDKGLLGAAKKFQVEYIVTGRISSVPSLSPRREKTLLYNFIAYNSISGEKLSFSVEFERERPYNKLSTAIQKIEKFLLGKKAVEFVLQSSVKGAMVYLDNIYLGRTPLSRKVLPGKYDLRLVQDGYETVSTSIQVASTQKNYYRIQNKKSKGVKTDYFFESLPSGANVYLNLKFIGKTPFQIKKLPKGTHQLSFRKKGYINHYMGLSIGTDETDETGLEKQKRRSIQIKMKKGDTLDYYTSERYAIGNLGYSDLSFYSIGASLGFYLGSLYYRSEELTNENANASFSGYSLGLSIFFLLTAAYFSYQNIEQEHDRGFGSVSNIESTEQIELSIIKNNKEEASLFSFKDKWIHKTEEGRERQKYGFFYREFY